VWWVVVLCDVDGFGAGVGVVLVVVVFGVVEVVVVVTVVVGVVLVDGWQLAVTLATGGVPGGSIWAGGVPGAALTVNVSVWPSSSVAVTVHVSAEADGIAAMPIVPMTMPMMVMAIFSLRLVDTRSYLLPPQTLAAPNTQEPRARDANGWCSAFQT
jgi:hypothetical protein